MKTQAEPEFFTALVDKKELDALRENARTMHMALWEIANHRRKTVQSFAAQDMVRIAREALDIVHGVPRKGDDHAAG